MSNRSRFPEPPPRQRIDGRMPDVKAAGLRNVHRGMDGTPLSGTDETGARVSFPQRPATTAPAPALPKASAMTTGNPTVSFKSPAEKAAVPRPTLTPAGKTSIFDKGRSITVAQQKADRGVMRRPDGSPGGLIDSKGKLSSIYGTGSVRTAPTPGTLTASKESGAGRFPTVKRLADETGDRTKEFVQAPRTQTSGRIFDETGDVTASFAPKPAKPRAIVQRSTSKVAPVTAAAESGAGRFPKRRA